ncbi:MAG: alpha/beta fold hydrolase [Ectothiorhodospiraceae bacterium AqS1]|nr:alpha/beta fold hydrolase [Ectothiorhodospiraceae bacterium AqS1]
MPNLRWSTISSRTVEIAKASGKRKAHPDELLALFDAGIEDILRGQFGETGSAFMAMSRPWLSLIHALGEGNTSANAHDPSRKEMGRAITAIALFAQRLSLNVALSIRQAMDFEDRRRAMRRSDGKDAGQGAPPDSPPSIDAYRRIIRQADENFRQSARESLFDEALDEAFAALLQWLESDPDAAAGIARTLSAPATDFDPRSSISSKARRSANFEERILDGGDILTRRRACSPKNADALIIPGFFASSSLFDLDPTCSAMATLTRHGIDCWMLERGDRRKGCGSLGQQIKAIDRALDAVHGFRDPPSCKAPHRPALIGHFHGGTLALLHCLAHPGKAGALITLSTPIDFASEDDLLSHWLRGLEGERLIKLFKELPGGLSALLTKMISPLHDDGQGLSALPTTMDRTRSRHRERLEIARRIPPGFPGRCFLSMQRMLYRDNALMTKGIALGERFEEEAAMGGVRSASLDDLDLPILNVVGREDRIVPPDASRPLAEIAANASHTLLEYDGGHFDLFGDKATHERVFARIADWLGQGGA